MIIKKSNRSFYESLLKDLLKGFNRLYWFLKTYIKYHLLTIKYFLLGNKIKKHKISLLLPTKLRSIKFKNLVSSLLDKTSNDYEIELLILLDENEEQLNDYLKIINSIKNFKISYYLKNFSTNLQRINFLAEKSNFDLILAINDDIEFTLSDWNKRVAIEFSKINMDKPFSLWLRSDDVKYKYFHSNFPVINRSWYKKLSYHSPEKYFSHWWADNWICDLGKKSGKFLITHKIFIKHFNQFHLVNQKDKTYLDNQKKRNGEIDLENWNKYNYIRKDDANLLK